MSDLRSRVEHFVALPADALRSEKAQALEAFADLRAALNAGSVRAAEPDATSPSRWRTNGWVKQGILLGFKLGTLSEIDANAPWQFFDKETVPVRRFELANNVRLVPGGTTIRDGAFIAPGVILMPPAYVNIGAYVGEGTLIDSHALVGSCAQVGARVHVSAAAQIGGVLEPAGALPVIIEDDVLLGGNTGIYEGCIVGRRAVLASGVILTGSTRIYDLVKGLVYSRQSDEVPLMVPEGAVVVAGSRSVAHQSEFANQHGLSTYAPIIVKYRDEKTDAKTALEDALR